MNIQSMTGFGQAEEKGVRVEVRSVNHRYLDPRFRIPVFINPYEIALRNMIKERFARGRFDVTIALTDKADVKLNINRGLAGNLFKSLRELQEDLGLKEGPSLDHLFWFRDILFREEPEYNPEDLIRVFESALDRLAGMRQREGEHLVRDILTMVEVLEKHLEAVRAEVEGVLEKTYERIKVRIAELAKETAIDDTRLLQEAAFLAEKADISEEITRIQSHISQIRKIISEGGTIGRKLDFLLQELLREINTIGSKSSEYRVSDLVIQMKTEIEKMKEQVQNLQ
ncbi:MAG: YicC/YloC family endoribonuclease [Nitrospirota bacterium]|nr:YicC/YloC family endoribonuclease [Nitrospirota bacterium]